MGNKIHQYVTSINLELDGIDVDYYSFVDAVDAGDLEFSYYQFIEKKFVDFVSSILRKEKVKSLELVLDNSFFSDVEHFKGLDVSKIELVNGKSYFLDDLNSIFASGLRDLWDYGLTDRQGHFVAFLGDGWVHIGHVEPLNTQLLDDLPAELSVEDVSDLFVTTDNYERL